VSVAHSTSGDADRHGAPPEEPTPLELFLRTLKEKNDLPCFVKNVECITDVVHDPKARVQLLNNAIASDVALSARVLRIANSAIHAAAGRTVETCYQAIMLLGFGRMKDIAVGAAVFEHLNSKSLALKELMATSVITANQSVKLCAPAGVTQVETAYLCGIFRNLGELVVACYKPAEYAEFRARQTRPNEEECVTDVKAFGFRFDELGRAMAQLWGLPASITEALQRPPALRSAPTDRTGRLAAVTQLSADMTQAIYRSSRSQQTAKLRTAILQYGTALGVSEAEALTAARTAFAASAGALKAVGSSIDPSMFEARLSAMEETAKLAATPGSGLDEGAGESLPRDADGSFVFGEASATPIAEVNAGHHGAQSTSDGATGSALAESATARVANALRGAMSGKRPLTMDEAINKTLAALLTVGFQRGALLLGADNYTRMKTRSAVGDGQEFLSDLLNIVLQPPNGALAVALLRREEVFAELKQGSPVRADPSVKRLRSLTVVLLPVIVGGQPIGALFADTVRTPVTITPDLRLSLVEIRDALNHALERLREKASAAAAARSVGAGV